MLDIFIHHMKLPVEDVVTLDELNSDRIAHVYMFDVGADGAWRVPSSVGRVPANSKVDRTSFEPFSVHWRIGDRNRNFLQLSKICKARSRPHEAIQNFPDLSDVPELRSVR